MDQQILEPIYEKNTWRRQIKRSFSSKLADLGHVKNPISMADSYRCYHCPQHKQDLAPWYCFSYKDLQNSQQLPFSLLTASQDHSDDGDDAGGTWQHVNRKRSKPRRRLVVGGNSDTSVIKSVEKKVVLHVSRVDPKADVRGMESFLKTNFREPTFLLLNIQCINCDKVNDLSVALSDFEDLKFICLTETWATEASIKNYKINLVAPLETMRQCDNFDAGVKLAEKKWPSETYQKAQQDEGNPVWRILDKKEPSTVNRDESDF
nr:unnamed protein product [Callosobruchus analis]